MLSRRWIINYVLIILIIVFTYIGNRYDVKTGYQPDKALSPLRPAEIEFIDIQTPDESLALRRDSHGWTLELPIQWPANQVNVGRLLEIVDTPAESSLPADEIDLSTLGLDFPRARLRLNQQSILFGATNNIGARRYVKIDSTVYLLPDLHLPFIQQGLPGLVDRRLLPRSLPLQSLSLPDFVLTRSGADGWQSQPDAGMDKARFAELIADWQGLEAARVKPYRAGETPRQKITARLEDDREFEFFLMSIDPEIVIANPALGLQYHFNKAFYYRLVSLRDDENPA